MACINIKIGNNEYKIYDNNNHSELLTSGSPEWDIVFKFINLGEIPNGFKIEASEEALSNLTAGNIYNEVIEKLSDTVTNKDLFKYTLFGNITQSEFINKLIGNNELNVVLDDDERYDTSKFDRNVLFVDNVDSKSWMGFTENRAVLITGNRFYRNDYKIKTFYKTYQDLKNNFSGEPRVKHIINTINTLFNKYNSEDNLDIFTKFTWLVNNKTAETAASLFIPYMSKVSLDRYKKTDMGDKAKTHSLIRDYSEEVIGTFFRNKSNELCMIQKVENNVVTSYNTIAKKSEEYQLSSINVLYKPFSVNYKNNNYYLIDSSWVKLNKDKQTIEEVSSSLNNSLYESFLGTSVDGFESYDFKINNDVTFNVLSKNIDLKKLPDNMYIVTNKGVYYKREDGKYYNNYDEVLGPKEKINHIYIDSETSDDIKNIFKTLSYGSANDLVGLTNSDIKVILQDVFNIHDFNNVFIKYNQTNLMSFGRSKTNGNYLIMVGTKNLVQLDDDTIQELTLANIFYNNLNSGKYDSILVEASPNALWNLIKDYYGNNEAKELLKDDESVKSYLADKYPKLNFNNTIFSDLINDLDREFNNSNKEIFADALENNKKELLSTYSNKEDEIDSFIKQLIDSGLYITSCEL